MLKVNPTTPKVVPPGAVIRAEWTLERLGPGMGSLVLQQPETTVETLLTAWLSAHVSQVLNDNIFFFTLVHNIIRKSSLSHSKKIIFPNSLIDRSAPRLHAFFNHYDPSAIHLLSYLSFFHFFRLFLFPTK